MVKNKKFLVLHLTFWVFQKINKVLMLFKDKCFINIRFYYLNPESLLTYFNLRNNYPLSFLPIQDHCNSFTRLNGISTFKYLIALFHLWHKWTGFPHMYESPDNKFPSLSRFKIALLVKQHCELCLRFGIYSNNVFLAFVFLLTIYIFLSCCEVFLMLKS